VAVDPVGDLDRAMPEVVSKLSDRNAVAKHTARVGMA
jgi:hypothetical protein